MRLGRSLDAATAAASRSPTRSAPTNSAPRCAATVSPLPRNSRLLITVTDAPLSRSPVNAVACGCHSLGSTCLSHASALSSRSVPGIREVKPTSPCAPGGRAVPSELRLVAVVDGTPAVPGAWRPISEARYGAASAYRSSSRAPRPSTRNTTYAGASGSTRPPGDLLVGPVLDPDGRTHRGHHVDQRTAPVGRLDEGRLDGRAHAPWVRADRESAKASSSATASVPSAVAEARMEKSSEASTPV